MTNYNSKNISTAKFWDNHYESNNHPWDLNSPTPIFVNWSKTISNKKKYKILIPGCGRGHDALYFAMLGHDVYALDFSKKALSFLKNKAKKKMLKLI